MTRTTRDISRANRLSILRHLYAGKAASRPDLSRHTGLSPATVANVVTDLIAAGIVVETGVSASAGGRPRAMLAINAAAGGVVGIDVAETYVDFELFDLGIGHVHTVMRALAPGQIPPGQVIDHLVAGLRQLLEETGTEPEAVVGVGISLPGLVDRETGVSVVAPNWTWRNVPLPHLLRERIDLPVFLDNPLKASATAELWFGAGWQADDVITLTLGTGIGAGIIVNGSVFRGGTNSAGEWGHTVIALDGRACRCGRQGCLEAYVGAPGIVEHLREIDPASPLLSGDGQDAVIAGLAVNLNGGDPMAANVVRATARYLGAGVSNLVNLFNPGVVVLGGWVGVALGTSLLLEVEREVARHALEPSLRATVLQLSELRHNPVSMGMATIALESWLAEQVTMPARASPAAPLRRQFAANDSRVDVANNHRTFADVVEGKGGAPGLPNQ